MFFFNQEIKRLKSQLQEDGARIQSLNQSYDELARTFDAARNNFATAAEQHFDTRLSENARQTAGLLQAAPPCNIPGWDVSRWKDWAPQEPDFESALYFGKLQQSGHGLNEPFTAPAFINFFGQNNSVIVESGQAGASEVYGFFQSLALRINARLLHNVNFTFIDPSGFGKAFPIARQLNTRLDPGDLYRQLEEIGRDITRINQTYGLPDDRMFDSIADTILINEKFEIIFVANFPKDYDRRVIEKLLKIADQGPIAGKYVFIHYNTDEELPRDISLDVLSNALRIALHEGGFTWNINNRNSLLLDWIADERPPDDVTEMIIKKIKDSIPKENPIDWEAIRPEARWSGSSVEYIETKIGLSGNKAPLNIWFGRKHNEGSRQCVHAILAGMPGSGKSNFYHAFILGLVNRYSPKEISLYLIDGKDGVEFHDYKRLPHAEFVSLKSLPSLSRSILKDLTEEIERRNQLFSEEYGVDNYENFRRKAGDTKILPRILLIVDEYQELFEDDNTNEASTYLRRISEEGRSAGIHMLLGSQRFGTVNMMNASSIFGNVHMRIAMKLSLSDRQALTEFGKEGKDLLANCDLPGKVVINDQSGDDGYNKFGKVAIIRKEDRQRVLDELAVASVQHGIPPELLTTNIFNGTEQPYIINNTQLGQLLRAERWMSRQDMEVFARKAIYHGGIGETSWFSGEKPFVFWMGQEFNVRGHSNIVTRRRQRENILIIGDNNDARYGIKFGILSSAILNAPHTDISFRIADKSIPGTPWSDVLLKLSQGVIQSMKYQQQYVARNADILSMLASLVEEIEKRKVVDEDDRVELSTIMFLASDLDRIESLNLQMNKFGSLEESESGKLLRRIIVEGPPLGIHSVISFEGVMPMYNVFGKRNLDFFRHRIALQMSEQDAFDLVRRREASRLQLHGSKPIAAFYLDIGSNKSSVFMPYIVSKGIDETFIQEIAKKQTHG